MTTPSDDGTELFSPTTFPLISVIIPTFNRPELLLSRALSSALAQSYPHLEVLVVTDGPDPRTEAALNTVDDIRLRRLALPANAGPSAARNFGVQAARGEWVAFLDDDDEWRPEKLVRQLECAQHSPHALPVVFSSWITRTPEGDTLNPPRLKEAAEPLGDYLLTRRSPRLPECGLTISMVFAPRTLLQTTPFPEDLRKHEDWDWMLKAEQVSGVGFEQLAPEDASALTIYYFAENRDFASKHTAWAPSLAWAQGHRQAGRLSERAFAGFIVSQLAPFPAATYDGRGFLALSRALSSTHPNAYEWLRYLKLWALPAPLRRTLKRLWVNARKTPTGGQPLPTSSVRRSSKRDTIPNLSSTSTSLPRSVTLIDPFADGHHVPYAVWLCQQLQAQGVEVSLIGPPTWVEQVNAQSPVRRLAALPLYEGSKEQYYNKGRLHEHKSSYVFAKNALKLARSWNSEVAHFVFFDSFLLSLFAAKRYAGSMRLYTTLHWAYFLPRFAPHGRSGRLRALAQLWTLRQLLRQNVRLHVHTPSLETEIGQLTQPGQVRYIPHPAEPPYPHSMDRGDEVRTGLGIGQDDRLLLAFGGTRRNKGVDVAVRALAHLPPNYHLMVLGKAEDFGAEELTKLASEQGVQNRLHLRLEFLPREQYEPYFAAADSVVLPYTRSFAGQSGVMFIAGSMGVPVTTSDSGTIAELVQLSNLGDVFRSGDPADMARAVSITTAQRLTVATRRMRQQQFMVGHSVEDFGRATLTDYSMESSLTLSPTVFSPLPVIQTERQTGTSFQTTPTRNNLSTNTSGGTPQQH